MTRLRDLGVSPGELPPGRLNAITDAPASTRLLERMAKRAAFGIARTGGTAHETSGDLVIAFSTTNRTPQQPPPPERRIAQVARISEDVYTTSALFDAVAEAVEEAILNSLVAAETMVGRDDHVVYALPRDELADLLTYYRRRSEGPAASDARG